MRRESNTKRSQNHQSNDNAVDGGGNDNDAFATLLQHMLGHSDESKNDNQNSLFLEDDNRKCSNIDKSHNHKNELFDKTHEGVKKTSLRRSLFKATTDNDSSDNNNKLTPSEIFANNKMKTFDSEMRIQTKHCVTTTLIKRVATTPSAKRIL
jgi:hypothetical protein